MFFIKTIFSRIYDQYVYMMENLRDRRADDLPLMSSIWPTVFICLSYVYIIKIAGPAFMKDRKPYELKYFVIAYNLFQTIFSLWGFTQGWSFYVSGNYSWKCEPVDYSQNPDALRALTMAYIFYISKIIDMVDSFIFLLKKKFTHLSFLHVFHHGIMPFYIWWGPRFVGGGQVGFSAFLNAGVHSVMYLYYLLAACGPHLQKYLWWKKYLTRMQMTQFVLVFLHSIQTLYYDCNYPKIIAKLMILNMVIFFVLFGNYYFYAYIKKKNKSKKM